MPTPEELIAAQAKELDTLKGDFAALKQRAEGQSQTIGSLQGLQKKYEALEAKLADGRDSDGKKTPVEQQLADLRKELANKDRQAILSRLESSTVEHLADKVISRKVAKDLAKAQVKKLDETKTAIAFDDDGVAILGEGEAAVKLPTHLDALLETELADYRPAKANPSRDGMNTAGGVRLPSTAKGYHINSHGVTVVHPLEAKK